MADITTYIAIRRRIDELRAEAEQLGDYIDRHIDPKYRGDMTRYVNLIQSPLEDLEYRVVHSIALADPAAKGLCLRCGSAEVDGVCQGTTLRSNTTCQGSKPGVELPSLHPDGHFRKYEW